VISATPTGTPVTGALLAQDSFQRANQAHWGTASDGLTWGGDANTQAVFSIVNNMGQLANGAGPYNAVLGPAAANAEVLFTGALSSFANSNLGAVLRWQDTNDLYKAYIDGTSLVVQKRVGGAATNLATAPFAATAGTAYSLRFRVVGTTLYAKVWAAASPEPSTWTITATDASLASGQAGLRIQVTGTAVASVTSFQATTE